MNLGELTRYALPGPAAGRGATRRGCRLDEGDSVSTGRQLAGEAGPAEQAGKQVDESLEKARDYTSEKMEEMGEAIEHAGEEMQK